MIKLFYHIFYRVYYWNIYVIKEKDLPIFSSFLSVSALLGLNINSFIIGFLVFVVKEIELYPNWGFWIIMLISMAPNYFIFIKNKRYETILRNSESMNRSEKKKWDKAIIIYIVVTILIVVFVSISSRNFKINHGIIPPI